MSNIHYTSNMIIILIAATLLLAHPSNSSQQFDPYQLNGGLVAAVAGRDYVLIASDTRLTDGGYGIKSRNYLSGRIWSAHSSSTTSTPLSQFLPSTHHHLFDDNDVKAEKEDDDETVLSETIAIPRRIPNNNLWDSDGSLIAPSSNDVVVKGSSETITSLSTTIVAPNNQMELNMIHSYPTTTSTTHIKSYRIQSNVLPIMIGSAGCASDCEALKRRMRLELDALLSSCSSSLLSSSNNNNNNSRIEVQSVANLLQQILYGRRTFPFYSFCVVAGIDTRGCINRRGKGKKAVGAVYVYDAIGSYERVAVACAGTGRELLQPVLDRLFSSSSSSSSQQQRRKRFVLNDEMDHEDKLSTVEEEEEEEESLTTTIPAGKQRMGTAGSLRPPVITHVNCPWEEAVRNVAHAYMSVAEREISVGDELVICVVDTSSPSSSSNFEGPMINVFSYPLKKH